MRRWVLAAALIAAPLGTAPYELAEWGAASASAAIFQSGSAVYYGGRRDARTTLTAAHRSLPFGTWVRVTHRDTGRSVLVMINDRGPFGNASRVIDLSRTAASALGMLSQGVAPVTLSIVSRP